jgi:K(+)-stimulated pyrophosphate-energized sodium pump
LIAPAVVAYSVGAEKNTALRISIALIAAAIIAAAVVFSKRKGVAVSDGEGSGLPNTSANEKIKV